MTIFYFCVSLFFSLAIRWHCKLPFFLNYISKKLDAFGWLIFLDDEVPTAWYHLYVRAIVKYMLYSTDSSQSQFFFRCVHFLWIDPFLAPSFVNSTRTLFVSALFLTRSNGKLRERSLPNSRITLYGINAFSVLLLQPIHKLMVSIYRLDEAFNVQCVQFCFIFRSPWIRSFWCVLVALKKNENVCCYLLSASTPYTLHTRHMQSHTSLLESR